MVDSFGVELHGIRTGEDHGAPVSVTQGRGVMLSLARTPLQMFWGWIRLSVLPPACCFRKSVSVCQGTIRCHHF